VEPPPLTSRAKNLHGLGKIPNPPLAKPFPASLHAAVSSVANPDLPTEWILAPTKVAERALSQGQFRAFSGRPTRQWISLWDKGLSIQCIVSLFLDFTPLLIPYSPCFFLPSRHPAGQSDSNFFPQLLFATPFSPVQESSPPQSRRTFSPSVPHRSPDEQIPRTIPFLFRGRPDIKIRRKRARFFSPVLGTLV